MKDDLRMKIETAAHDYQLDVYPFEEHHLYNEHDPTRCRADALACESIGAMLAATAIAFSREAVAQVAGRGTGADAMLEALEDLRIEVLATEGNHPLHLFY